MELDTDGHDPDVAESSRTSKRSCTTITTRADIIWDALEKFWPMEDRPEHLQVKETVALMTIAELKELKSAYGQADEDPDNKKHNLIRDVKPKVLNFREGKDDHFNMLHQARWLRLPLEEFKNWWHKTPIKRNETYLSMDLEFAGCLNVVADKTLSEMHDRRNQMTLKKFLAENVSVASRPKVETKTMEEGLTSTSYDLNWQKPTSLTQVMEGVHNYATVNHFLYPFCPMGLNLLRLLNKYQWLIVARSFDDKNRVDLIKTFFNLSLKKVANAANNGKPIPSFKELEELLKSTLSQSGYSTEIPTTKKQNGKDNSGGFNSNNSNNSGFRGTGYNKQRVQKNSSDGTKNWANINGVALCFDWNDRTCNNARTTVQKYDGCVAANNKKRIHLCNSWLTDKNTFCYKSHPKKHHR